MKVVIARSLEVEQLNEAQLASTSNDDPFERGDLVGHRQSFWN